MRRHIASNTHALILRRLEEEEVWDFKKFIVLSVWRAWRRRVHQSVPLYHQIIIISALLLGFEVLLAAVWDPLVGSHC